MRAAAAAVAAIVVCAAAPAQASPGVEVQLLALNDLHGHLEAAPGLSLAGRPAGGVEYLATHVRRLRAANPDRTLVVSAGDLVGGSPLLSALFHDEPTIEAMNLLGLDFNAVGNHELDEGAAELVRLARGGCHPVDGCRDGDGFDGARFGFLAANTWRSGSDQRLFAPYAIRSVDGVRIAFVGVTLEGTPLVVAPGGADGLEFHDEAETVNALVPRLQRRGVEAIVVLLHEGGEQAGGVDECAGISGPVVDIVERTSREVDLFVTGHTHEAYDCVIDGRPVTSAGSYGRVLTDLDLVLDRPSGEVRSVRIDNVVVDRGVPRDRRQVALLDRYRRIAAPLSERVVATAATVLDRGALLEIVADAFLDATRGAGAQLALANPTGVRAEIDAGDVTYAELFAVQPFGLDLVTLTLTGTQLRRVLEQQWSADAGMLAVSSGFTYAYDLRRPTGERVDPASLRLADAPVLPEGAYRVTVSRFLAEGGDGFAALVEGADRHGGVTDLEALQAHLGKLSPVSHRAVGRVTRTG